MTAAATFAALTAAEAELSAENGGLRVRTPKRLSPALLADVRAVKPLLLAVVSGSWRAELAAWSDELRDEHSERAAIREFDGGEGPDLAERSAFLEIASRLAPPAPEPAAEPTAAIGLALPFPSAFPGALPGAEGPAGAMPAEGDARGAEGEAGPPSAPRGLDLSRTCRACGCRSVEAGRCIRCGWERPTAERSSAGPITNDEPKGS